MDADLFPPLQDDGDWWQQPIAMQPLLALEVGDPEDDGAALPPDTSASYLWGRCKLSHVMRSKTVDGETLS